MICFMKKTALIDPPTLSCNIQHVSGYVEADCPVLMTTQHDPQSYAVLSGKLNNKLSNLRQGEKKSLMSMVAEHQAVAIDGAEEVRPGTRYWRWLSHSFGGRFIPGESGLPMMAQGNNSATRLVALHTGVVGNVGLAMLITNAPPVAFKLERVSGGATAAAAKAVIQGKLRMPSTLEQFLHGGEIVKPRELMGLNDLIARRITHLAGPTPRGNAYVGVLQP